MDTERLRAETRTEHENVEGLLPLMDADLDLATYARVLRCMYTVVRPWEQWALANAPVHLAPLVRERQRSAMLEADLRRLGEVLEPSQSIAATSGQMEKMFGAGRENPEEFEARFLGAMYVVEGSTLGGQYIARHVEEVLGFALGEGDAYFRGHADRTGMLWHELKQALHAIPEKHTSAVVAAAKAMFGHFADAVRAVGIAATPTLAVATTH